MSLELADRSIQYPRGIAEDVLIKIDKFILHIEFVILDMREDSKILIILGRPFLATSRAMIDVFNKKITLRVGSEENDQLNENLEDGISQHNFEKYDSESETPIWLIKPINTLYSHGAPVHNGIQNEHLYYASAIEIYEKRPELKELSSHLEYAYLKGDKSCPERFKPVIQPQRRLNPKVQDMVKNEIVKLLDSGLIYLISDSPWVSPIHVIPKKGGMTVVLNDNNELIPSRTMLERLSGNEYYCFLDGFSGFFEIPTALEDQENTTFTCPYGTFAYRRMPFGLCNAPATFQRCMTTIFHDMVEDFMEVFMDDFLVFGNSFDQCLNNLDKILGRCEETNLVLN
ncbi:reverse transcriptase domain-containing protein [Tanacetum coccineum]